MLIQHIKFMSKRNRFHGRVQDAQQNCHWPDCDEVGDFRAPKQGAARNDCLWFCLEHVREYNENWDFFKGQTPDQIEAFMNGKNIWHKPTWPMGKSAEGMSRFGKVDWAKAMDNMKDNSGLFGDVTANMQQAAIHTPEDAKLFNRPLTREDRRFLQVMEIDLPTTPARIKAHYKIWVKKLHPDLVGDDENASNKLRAIIEAYTHLSKAFRKTRKMKQDSL